MNNASSKESVIVLAIIGYFLYLIFSQTSIKIGIVTVLISILVSAIGIVALYLYDKNDFTIPETWTEWVYMYFAGLLFSGVIIFPIIYLPYWLFTR